MNGQRRVVVLAHTFEEELGVYRVVLADEHYVEQAGEDGEPELVPVRENVRDVVFTADAGQWFRRGKRRPHQEVMQEQHELIRRALQEQDRSLGDEQAKVKHLIDGPMGL